jgi:hypothetical protein
MSELIPKPNYLGDPIYTQVLCPHCNQAHDVNPSVIPPEPTLPEPQNTRQWASCPVTKEDYLVGIGGYLFLPQDPVFTPIAP